MTAAPPDSMLSSAVPDGPGPHKRGIMLVLASPPGGGKTSISRELMRLDSNVVVSISATTREPRPGEIEGKHYFFVTRDKFKKMIDDGEMLEHAEVYGKHLYGTPKKPVEKALTEGKDVLFDIDWQGTRRLDEIAPHDVVSVFLLPPSWKELEKRLHGRAQDSVEEINRRLSMAQDEIAHYREFKYVIINNNFADSVYLVHSILKAERQKLTRFMDLQSFVDTLKPGQ